VLRSGALSIQWYPGHMAKARRELAKAFPKQDVIIEVLDARMPYASSNPIVTALRKQKPCIKILSKADLADPAITLAWVRHLENQSKARDAAQPFSRVIAIASSSDRLGETKNRIPELCKRLVGHPTGPGRSVRAIVVGIPNVGKSTLINLLLGRKVAKVGDEPAVTKMQQLVTLPSGITLSDNPGLLWPKISDPKVGFRLAFGGAISEAALDYETIARYGAEVLLKRYPSLLQTRYKLTELPATGAALLAEIGRKRSCLKSGGVVDMHKAADVLIHDFRDGVLGRISLETPDDLDGAMPENEPDAEISEDAEEVGDSE
jgi:ribosome biogenesis GTPase A